jgi:hypothetical protein
LSLRFSGKSFYEILLSRKRVIPFVLFALVLLILLMPIVFSLPRGTWLSPTVLVVYLRELLVSVVIVVSFGATWKVLNDPTSILRRFKIRRPAAGRAESSQQTAADEYAVPPDFLFTANPGRQSEVEIDRTLLALDRDEIAPIYVAGMGLDNALRALDRGEISRSVVEETQQIYAFKKWMRGDDVGWYELWEMVQFGGSLQPVVRSILEKPLQHLQQIYPVGLTSAKNVERIQLILSYDR